MAKIPKQIEHPAPAPTGGARKSYVVTDKAPPRVAGRRVNVGDVLHLTEVEARGELLALHLVPSVSADNPASKEV